MATSSCQLGKDAILIELCCLLANPLSNGHTTLDPLLFLRDCKSPGLHFISASSSEISL